MGRSKILYFNLLLLLLVTLVYFIVSGHKYSLGHIFQISLLQILLHCLLDVSSRWPSSLELCNSSWVSVRKGDYIQCKYIHLQERNQTIQQKNLCDCSLIKICYACSLFVFKAVYVPSFYYYMYASFQNLGRESIKAVV